ncbi:SGNH/GDSL hydrolase family protein [Desulfobulbus propionicus]
MNKKPLQTLLILLILIFFASVVVNCILLRHVFISFEKVHFARVFPLGYAAQTTKIKPEIVDSNRSKKIIILGDSRAAMWETSELEVNFEVLNLAHGGQTSLQVLMQLFYDPIPKAEWILLQVGINDLHPIGAFKSHKNMIVNNLEDNICRIVKKLEEDGYRVIITTLFPTDAVPLVRTFFWDSKTSITIKQVNKHIMALKNDRTIFVQDSYTLLANKSGQLQGQFVDSDFFLHINSYGYKTLTEDLITIISRD